MKKLTRCAWVSDDPLYIDYHDLEWGVPVYDERHLFEFLILEGAQAGLSWITVLKKRVQYRQSFDQFDPEKIARYDERKCQELLNEAGIIRNRLKIQAAITNARAFLALKNTDDSFSKYLWQFVDGRPKQNHWQQSQQIPTFDPISESMSKDLKRRGFKFVGSTICYAFMQAVGMVNDHLTCCFRHEQCASLVKKSHLDHTL